MSVLGIRAEPRALTWAVVEGTRENPILVGEGKASAPPDYDEPQALKWYRSRVLLLLSEYSATAIAIRLPESFGRQGNSDSDRKRSRIEGVLMELGASQGLAVIAGNLRTIGTRQDVRNPRDALESQELRGLDWSDLNSKVREAVFAAASGLETVG